VSTTIDDHGGRVQAALLGALAGEAAAGTAAGAADLLGVAESVAATGGFDEADMRNRGLEKPSRGGTAGLLLRAVPFGLIAPLDRAALRRSAHRCVVLAGADEGTAVSAVAVAMLTADLLRFDLDTSLLRVHQSLLEDAPLALLDSLRPDPGSLTRSPEDAEPAHALQAAITALEAGELDAAVDAARGGPAVSVALAGALAGARDGSASLWRLDAASLPHGERAMQIAHRFAARLDVAPAAQRLTSPADGHR